MELWKRKFNSNCNSKKFFCLNETQKYYVYIFSSGIRSAFTICNVNWGLWKILGWNERCKRKSMEWIKLKLFAEWRWTERERVNYTNTSTFNTSDLMIVTNRCTIEDGEQKGQQQKVVVKREKKRKCCKWEKKNGTIVRINAITFIVWRWFSDG